MDGDIAQTLPRGRGHGVMPVVSRRPPAGLQDYVTDYQAYYDDERRFRQLTLPSASVVLIISFGESIRMLDADGGERERHNSFLAGISERPGLIESTGLSYGLQVNLTPIGARMFAGLPMHLLSNRVLELDDVLGSDAGELIGRLEEAHTWTARFSMIDAFIARRISAGERPDGVLWAYRSLRRDTIGSIAERLGCSNKHLIAQFREQLGLPPKTIARIMRFDRAVRALRSGRVDLAQVAADCGYYDQAHLSREFREFSGMTPGRFVFRCGPVYESVAG